MFNKTTKLIFLSSIAILIIALSLILIKNTKSIDKIELNNIAQKVDRDDQVINILFLGDMMFDRGVEKWLLSVKKNPFENMAFKSQNFPIKNDLVVGNLEGPITDTHVCQKKLYSFEFATSTADLLKSAGVDYVSLANNHSNDCFSRGFEDTKFYLKNAGIGFFGGMNATQSYATTTIKGKKIVIIGVDLTIMPFKIEEVYALIQKLKTENDYIIVFLHWGTESVFILISVILKICVE